MIVRFVAAPCLIHIIFEFERPRWIRVELSNQLLPSRGEAGCGFGALRKIIADNRFSQSLCGSCLECEWYQMMSFIRRFLAEGRLGSDYVAISVAIQDGAQTPPGVEKTTRYVRQERLYTREPLAAVAAAGAYSSTKIGSGNIIDATDEIITSVEHILRSVVPFDQTQHRRALAAPAGSEPSHQSAEQDNTGPRME
jgi:hypothetical protein